MDRRNVTSGALIVLAMLGIGGVCTALLFMAPRGRIMQPATRPTTDVSRS